MYPFTFLRERAETKIEMFPVKEKCNAGIGNCGICPKQSEWWAGDWSGTWRTIKLQMMFGFRARERPDWSDSKWIESNLLVVCQRKRWKAIKAIAFPQPPSRPADELGHVQPEFNWMANYVDWISQSKVFNWSVHLKCDFTCRSKLTVLYRRRSAGDEKWWDT